MGLWQNLVAGYDENEKQLSDVASNGLYPLSSTTISNQSDMLAVIVLDQDGHFIRSESIPRRNGRHGIVTLIPIPVTQESLNRTGHEFPHPVFDQREYVFPDFVAGRGQKATDKNTNYKALLQEFVDSKFAPPAVRAVCTYVSDVVRDFSEDLPRGTNAKTPILFKVELPGCSESSLWKMPALFSGWHAFYSTKVAAQSAKALDFVSGGLQPVSQFHPKKVLSLAGNAKLVSANDATNFTFRGIYRHPKNVAGKKKQNDFIHVFGLSDAVTVGYESSQKAHQFLRYLIATQGIACGNQVIIPFSIAAAEKKVPAPPIIDDWDEDETTTVSDSVISMGLRTGKDYAQSIRNALHGYERDGQWKAHARSAIVVVEAATPGRLSITFYREFASAEYMERIAAWHERCKWPLRGKDAVWYFGAPSIDSIIKAAFGWHKSGRDEAYEKTRMRARQNLICSIFDGSPIPSDYLANAIRRVSAPLGVADDNGHFDRGLFSSILATTCSLLKHQYANTKESFDMSLDPTRTDRDYLYGRLLGAADKLEEYALHKRDNDRLVTAAIRHMATFSQRPFSAWQIIHTSLLPYIQTVRGSFADRELQSIQDLFDGSKRDFEDDRPLSGSYLVGYYHEREYIDELVRQASAKSSTTIQDQEN